MLSGDDLLAVTSSVDSSISLYYALGGAVLVVLAGIWGFKRVMFLLDGGGRGTGFASIEDEDKYISSNKYPDENGK